MSEKPPESPSRLSGEAKWRGLGQSPIKKRAEGHPVFLDKK